MGTPQSKLVLIDPQGHRVKIADIVNGEVVEENGTKWLPIALTIPARKNIKPGSRLQIVDTAQSRVISTFVAESISMFFRGKQFSRIDGKHYIV